MKLISGLPTHGKKLSTQELEQLRAGELSAEGEDLQLAADTMRNRERLLNLEMLVEQQSRSVEFFICGDTSTAVMTREGQEPELALLTTDSIPMFIARTIGLGPAPFVDESDSAMRNGAFEQVIAGTKEVPRKIAKRDLGAVFDQGSWCMWKLEGATVIQGTPRANYRVDGFGAAGQGWWWLTDYHGWVYFSRTRSVTMWTELSCNGDASATM